MFHGVNVRVHAVVGHVDVEQVSRRSGLTGRVVDGLHGVKAGCCVGHRDVGQEQVFEVDIDEVLVRIGHRDVLHVEEAVAV